MTKTGVRGNSDRRSSSADELILRNPWTFGGIATTAVVYLTNDIGEP